MGGNIGNCFKIAAPESGTINGNSPNRFPDDYSQDINSGNCILYAALNTGTNGGVYI